MAELVLTADQVAAELEYLTRKGEGNGDRIRRMYREGEFPAPIDPTLPPVRWRWSRARVEQYVSGEWRQEALRARLGLRSVVGS